ncbi:nucleotide sugar dehydrogenase [Curvivirga aplysinae]|uniref:nucleotide sugar dehydrogenase n=1 Tax=Curvivirga aplysinae TaxID=2529852 RepID=UPI0022A6B2A4|nr:nucleotide sugar dehydrogenase [Curvivirga aplysinae]
MTNSKQPKISVIGLGKLGSPMAAVFASGGYQVIGLDKEPYLVEQLNKKMAPVTEPDLQKYIDKFGDQIRATTSYEDAITNSDISFVILPTPSQPDGQFSNEHLLSALSEIGKVLKNKPTYHLVVITSTVMPGSMDGEISAVIQDVSGKVLGKDFGLCYHPEFIALGNIIQNMLYPDLILIGESDAVAGQMIENIYLSICQKSAMIKRMSFINAELTKIAINTYVTTKISYANMLAEMCEKLPGADVDVVTNAIGADSRIGIKYLKGAIGYAGPCFPRDNQALIALGRKLHVSCDIAEATDRLNIHQIKRLKGIVDGLSKKDDHIAILGLAYKQDTAVIENSQSILLMQELLPEYINITGFDPMANSEAKSILPENICISETLESTIIDADIIIIMTPWAEFRNLQEYLESDQDKARIIIDPWRIVPLDKQLDNVSIFYLGQG